MDGNGGQAIAAVSTPPGLGGLCVVRVSGGGVWEIGDRLVPPSRRPLAARPPNTFFHAPVLDPETGGTVDDAVFLVFRAPHSYTGEDTLEIQGHGGILQSRRILEAVLAAGARLALPGEFSRRAFLNGRMDLTRAEAVCDLIHARSERAARLARAQLDGSLGGRIDAAYDRILSLAADIEHLLDFDEDDVPGGFLPETAAALSAALDEIRALADTSHEGLVMREGALVVISGRPNAGKSSLMNALLRRNRVIVNAAPGTTRDAIEEPYELEGVLLRLVDTAGLRDAADDVEREGISRAREWMGRADLNLHLVDRSAPDAAAAPPPDFPHPSKTLILFTKSDLPPAPGPAPRIPAGAAAALEISSKTGAGLDALKRAMLETLGVTFGGPPPVAVSLRHAEELRRALRDGRDALAALSGGPAGLVPAAIHLRNACEALGRITGRVYTEDLLDRVFSRFCVGK